MSDGKDSHNSKGDPFSQLTDMESTVRIDFGANHNVASTSDGPSPIDFEQTLDGLTDIDEILNNDEIADHSDDEPTISFSTDEIDFDELDAGINALSGDFPDEEKAEDDKLDDLDSILEDESALEPTPDTDTAVMLDTFNSDKESATKATAPGKGIDDWPLLDGDDGEYEAPAEEPLVEGSGEFDLPDMTTDDGTAVDSEENAPVIELTEEMLDEPEASSHEEVVSDDSATDEALLPHEGDAIDEIIDESDQDEAPKGNFDNLSETPELTTTETNILAGATAAIHDIAEEEKKIHKSEAEKEPVGQHPVPPGPVATKGGGSSATTVPTIMALLAIAAGGFAAWMAWDATNRIAYLESQVRNLQSAKATTTNRQSIVDIQQRLVKVERRLTGTPTIEAATTLGDVTTEATTAQEPAIAKSSKPAAKAITPETKIAQSPPKGDWVVNLSSHVKESAATREKARLIKMGLNAEVHSATIKNKIWYRVQIIGFATKNEAKAQLRDIQQRSGIQGAWVGKK